MRRKDREITDRNEIMDIVDRCMIAHLGVINDKQPYVVPMNFGYDDNNIYFHCAYEGLKTACIEKNSNVCLEGDVFHAVEESNGDITSRYESFIVQGRASLLTERDERVYALKKILEHYNKTEFRVESCTGLENTAVYKIEIESITGKRNLRK